MEYSLAAELKALPPQGSLPFKGIFVLRRMERRQARSGTDFLSVEFGDRTGSFRLTCFADSTHYPALIAVAPGSIFEVEGMSDYYNDTFSPKLKQLREVDLEEARSQGWMDRLAAVSPIDPDAFQKELEDHIAAIPQQELRGLIQLVLNEHGELFHSSPAAISMHHAYRHGLLEHTVRMLRCARALAPLYPEVDPGLALAGIVLHDMGKILEYGQGLVAERTRDGILQGHVVLGYRIVRKAAIQSRLPSELQDRLEHIILSHQGEPEWGAATRAATPEAIFVSMIDNLDAKMGMVQEILRQAPEGREFSDYHPGLQTSLLLPPLPAPRNPD